MSEHEHDEECEAQQAYALPAWKWSNWELVGIGSAVLGGVLNSIAQGCNLLAREAAASANWSRHNYELEQAQAEEEERLERDALVRAEMADELRGIVEGPEEMVFDETDGESEDDPS